MLMANAHSVNILELFYMSRFQCNLLSNVLLCQLCKSGTSCSAPATDQHTLRGRDACREVVVHPLPPQILINKWCTCLPLHRHHPRLRHPGPQWQQAQVGYAWCTCEGKCFVLYSLLMLLVLCCLDYLLQLILHHPAV